MGGLWGQNPTSTPPIHFVLLFNIDQTYEFSFPTSIVDYFLLIDLCLEGIAMI